MKQRTKCHTCNMCINTFIHARSFNQLLTNWAEGARYNPMDYCLIQLKLIIYES